MDFNPLGLLNSKIFNHVTVTSIKYDNILGYVE